jgi:hypothetical protein
LTLVTIGVARRAAEHERLAHAHLIPTRAVRRRIAPERSGGPSGRDVASTAAGLWVLDLGLGARCFTASVGCFLPPSGAPRPNFPQRAAFFCAGLASPAAGSRRNQQLTNLLVTLSRWTYAQKTSRSRAMAQSRSNMCEALRTSVRSARSSYSSTRCLPSGRGMFCPTSRSRTFLGRLCLNRLCVGPIYSRGCRPRQPSSTPVAVAGGERGRSRGSCSRQARPPAISSAGRTSRRHRSDSMFRTALRRCKAMRGLCSKLRVAPDRPPVMSLSDEAREEVPQQPARQVRLADTEPLELPPRRMCLEFRQQSMLGA